MPLKTLGPIGPRAVGERVKEPCKHSHGLCTLTVYIGTLFASTSILMDFTFTVTAFTNTLMTFTTIFLAQRSLS
jgi:hypothetical protein